MPKSKLQPVSTSEKRGRGRPTVYRPEFCERVIEMGKNGYSIASMASELDVDKATILRWRDEHEEFRTAFLLESPQQVLKNPKDRPSFLGMIVHRKEASSNNWELLYHYKPELMPKEIRDFLRDSFLDGLASVGKDLLFDQSIKPIEGGFI